MKDNFKIDIDLLNFLNDAYGSSHFFSDWAEKPEVVPTDKTHKNLLENNIISPIIYDYYNHVNLFEPFTKDQKYAYAPLLKHRRNLICTPYNLRICNAYYYRPDFIFKIGSIVYDSPIYSDIKKIETLLDLKVYFLEYEKGFNKGYSNFENDKINFLDPAFTDKHDRLKKVFEFITARPTNKKHYWGKLTFTQYNFTTDKEISNAFEDGLLQGYYYKAWTIVFTLNDFFAPLFAGLNLTAIIKKEVEAVEVKQSVEAVKSKKDRVWFKVGILFADGTMDKYWNDNKTGIKDEYTNPVITNKTGIKGGLKYITGTFNGYSKNSQNRDKNIFNDSKKVNLIIDHLKEHRIEIAQSFLDKVQTETNV